MSNEIRPAYTKKRVIVPLITALIFLLTGIYMGVHSIYFQTTDDAFIEGNIISISPKVKGHIIKLYIEDNMEVKKGDLLLEIDPVDYETALKQKEAELEMAQASLNMSDKQIKQSEFELKKSKEDITSTKAKLDFASKDFKRYDEMYKEGIVSKQDYEKSKTEYDVAKANNIMAFQHKNASDSTLQTSKIGRAHV